MLLSLVQHTRGKQAICASQPVRGYPALAQSMSVEPYLDLQRRRRCLQYIHSAASPAIPTHPTMARFNEQDRTLLYVVRSTARQLERGSWADCVAIYNRLASRPRTQDGLCNTYRSLDEAEMESRSRAAEWEAIREQVKEWLHDASQVCRPWTSEADW